MHGSGTTFFTLGLGDVLPHTALGRLLVVLEATGARRREAMLVLCVALAAIYAVVLALLATHHSVSMPVVIGILMLIVIVKKNGSRTEFASVKLRGSLMLALLKRFDDAIETCTLIEV